MEMKEEDKTVGQSLHTISKGIHDKVMYFTEEMFFSTDMKHSCEKKCKLYEMGNLVTMCLM